MKSVMRFALFLFLLPVLGTTQLSVAQGTDLGTVVGVVRDATGAVVPNAKVVTLDLATNSTHETKTNSQGEYRVFGLSAGTYQVSVSAAGMSTTKITGVRVNGSDTVSADAVLKVESSTEAVEVTAEDSSNQH